MSAQAFLSCIRHFKNGRKACWLRHISLSPPRCSEELSIIFKKANEESEESYDAKNEKLGRPMSPHLTIYKFQTTSMLSITHRITGMIWSLYTVGIGVTSFFSSRDFSQLIMDSTQGMGQSSVIVLKAMFIFPVAYHYFNGLRHLVWDTGIGLTLKGVYTTGYLMLLAVVGVCSGLMWDDIKKIFNGNKKAEEKKK